ncbi:4-hydroxy-3-methylbut-2-enyl diphosphate reductase [Carboxylicivirga marina]|uniref:4-hydroxy-3-methylbut-2-enyl diphosphate reductase n=1 Tax=Carboxylicivirga marina TaxID=2800988 RepID=UPI001F4448E9|nr:4-hydroxy-3-methylbut-2-enyl diphosphate reductase [Carboxylicivirga marina]
MIKVVIDKYSGFCFGVQKAIEAASLLLKSGEKVYCVGDIVHNEAESKRLSSLGMSIINSEKLNGLKDGAVLFRAHGEPPQSYQKVSNAGLQLKDATCPVVLKLQQRIKKAYKKLQESNGQLVIFGKKGHAEVIGLEGQTNNEAIVIEQLSDIEQLDFNRDIELFAQTTKSPELLKEIAAAIEDKTKAGFKWHNTTCKQVTGRVPRIKQFAIQYDVVVFVGGHKSSNAKVLFQACKEANANSYFVSTPQEVKNKWFDNPNISVGVCGATSTPKWLMEEVAESIRVLH